MSVPHLMWTTRYNKRLRQVPQHIERQTITFLPPNTNLLAAHRTGSRGRRVLSDPTKVQPGTRDGDIDGHPSGTVRKIDRFGLSPTGIHEQLASYLILVYVDDNDTKLNSY